MPDEKMTSEFADVVEESSELISDSTQSGGSTEKKEQLTEKTPNTEENYKYYLQGLVFLALLVLTTAVVGITYMLWHGINVIELFSRSQMVLSFGYIGGDKNPASIAMEIWVWCLIGVNCKLAYTSGRAVIRKRFQFLRYLTLWISTCLFAWGVAVAVVLSLQVISLSVADVEITLANASIETIIAVSFILGFYHEDARKLLGSLRGRIVTGMEEELEERAKSQEKGNKASDAPIPSPREDAA